MSDQPMDPGRRVVPLELFFDLVFVFAFTQVTTFLAETPTWGGLLRSLLLLGALWWAWSGYAWLTNTLDPEEGAVRLAMLAAAAATLIASLAVPDAFGSAGVVFGVAYLVVRALHLLLLAIAGRGDRDLFGAVLRTLPSSILAPVLLIVAGSQEGSAQMALWGVALAILYLAPLVGRMRGWRVSPEHLVERFGLMIIIALGESIFAIGIGATGLALDAGLIAAALLGFTVAACLWWSYFDWVVFVEQARLAEEVGARRAALARDVYSYLHLPMVAGIVLFAFGLKIALADTGAQLRIVPAFGLCGGIAAYMIAHVLLRLRIGGRLGRGRPMAAVLLAGLVPVATVVPALTALSLVTAVCVLLIAYEFSRHRESRAWIRSRRGAFTLEEAVSELQSRSTRRRPRGKRTHVSGQSKTRWPAWIRTKTK